MKHLTRLICFAFTALACGAPPQEPQGVTSGGKSAIPAGAAVTYDMPAYKDLATVDGLPGTPTTMSDNGVPMIDGVERPDYLPGNINDLDNRRARVTVDNPTGEYLFTLDALYPGEEDGTQPVLDNPAIAGFRNEQERYNYYLVHPVPKNEGDIGKVGLPMVSDTFHGWAFNLGGPAGYTIKGACWAQANAGSNCAFPTRKTWTWGVYWDEPSFGSLCGFLPSQGGTGVPFFVIDPINYIQEAFDAWRPEITTRTVQSGTIDANGAEQLAVLCGQLPSLSGGIPAFFGAVLAQGGPYGDLQRRVTNAKDAYGSCANSPGSGSSAFPTGMYEYSEGQIVYSASNMYDRATLCSANINASDVLHNASFNTFTHEFGHVLGFAHASTGLMAATKRSCADFFNARVNTVTSDYHAAMADFDPNGTTWHFGAHDLHCTPGIPATPALLPGPADNSTNSVNPNNTAD